MTRFAVINDERKVLLGIDKSNLFEPGYVYEAYSILDETIIRKIGEYALPKDASKGGFPNEMSEVSAQVYYGSHLITKEENEKLNERTNTEDI